MKIKQLIEDKINENLSNERIILKVIDFTDETVSITIQLTNLTATDKINDIFEFHQDNFGNEYVEYLCDTEYIFTKPLDYDYVHWLNGLVIEYTPITADLGKDQIYLRDYTNDK